MTTAALEDLGGRVIAIAQALAAGANPDVGGLQEMLVGQVGDRVGTTADGIRAAAEDVRARAQQAADKVQSDCAVAVGDAQSRLADTMSGLESERTRALAEAERAQKGADAAFEQARATGEQVADEAERTKQAALDAAEDARRQAEAAFEAAREEADRRFAEAKAAAEQALADAERVVADAQARFDDAVETATTAVNDAIDLAQQLPDQVTALGEDALARLEGALSWPSGILSLLAQALIWLKKNHFADVPELQVIWQQSDDAPGLGLLWLDGDQMVRLVYQPPSAGPGPGTLLIETKGADSIIFPNGADAGVSVTVTAKADHAVVVGAGVVPPDGSPDTLHLGITFGALEYDEALGPLTAILKAPTLTLDLSHAETWHYTARLAIPTYGGKLGLSGLLASAGVPLPITVPEIEELRSLTAQVSDGTFSLQEGASA
ncbi:MAG: hypothetical protein ABIM89_05230 [Mycobacteriales bacterium]